MDAQRLPNSSNGAADQTAEPASAATRRNALFAEYAEANSSFRTLTEIRFKLLALVPVSAVAAAAAAAIAGSGGLKAPGQLVILGICAFALVATFAVASYNARNDQLYLWHVDRAAAIERELGIPDGSFSHRPHAWWHIRAGGARWEIGHSGSVLAIYSAAITLWGTAALLVGMQLMLGTRQVEAWSVAASALVCAVLSILARRLIRLQKTRRRDRMVELGTKAIKLAAELGLPDAAPPSPPSAEGPRSQEAAKGRAAWHRLQQLIDACAELQEGEWSRSGARQEVTDRIEFFAGMSPDRRRRYFVGESGEPTAVAEYVALIVDLPPGWLTRGPRRR